MSINKEEIIKKYPSLCYTCKRARRPVSEEFVQQGYVGCTLLVEERYHQVPIQDLVSNIKSSEQFTGWVYLKRGIFQNYTGFMTGVWTNDQLMTKGTSSCKYYEKESL